MAMSSMSTARSASPSETFTARHVVLVGVPGCGKAAVGAELARQTGLPYLDGDALKPFRNLRKLRSGQRLSGSDLGPWLDRCGLALRQAETGLILGCSAARRSDRDRLRNAAGRDDLLFIHLTGPDSLLRARMLEQNPQGRRNRFQPVDLERIEAPGPGERALTGDLRHKLQSLVRGLRQAMTRPAPSAV